VLFLTLSGCDLVPKRYRIPQNGMYPNFPAKTLLWVKRRPYKTIDEVKRGDIVVFKRIQNDVRYDYIWRVVGLPKDTVNLAKTSVIINGRELNHSLVREDSVHTIYLEKNGEAEYLVAYEKIRSDSTRSGYFIIVPQGELFVLGDNRDNAADSRYHGAIKFDSIIGKSMGKEPW
jgi:signal peptidase I